MTAISVSDGTDASSGEITPEKGWEKIIRKSEEKGSLTPGSFLDQVRLSIERGETVPQPEIPEDFSQGKFIIKTREGRFLFMILDKNETRLSVPEYSLSNKELLRIALETCGQDYRLTEPEDFNYLWRDGRQITPDEHLWAGEDVFFLTSKKPLLSDSIYDGREKPNFGRTEIVITKGLTISMDTVPAPGMQEYYGLHPQCRNPTIGLNAYDLSWDGTPDVKEEFRYMKNRGGSRAYSVVVNDEERRRLIPFFWRMAKNIIGPKDRIVMISRLCDWMTPQLAAGFPKAEAIRRANVFGFKGGKPFLTGKEVRDDPAYSFEKQPDERFLVIDLSRHERRNPFFFAKTKTYEGLRIDTILETLEQ